MTTLIHHVGWKVWEGVEYSIPWVCNSCVTSYEKRQKACKSNIKCIVNEMIKKYALLTACLSKSPDGNTVCRMWQWAKCTASLSVFSITINSCLLAGGYIRGEKNLVKTLCCTLDDEAEAGDDQLGVEGVGDVVEDSVSSSSSLCCRLRSLCNCLWTSFGLFLFFLWITELKSTVQIIYH